MHAFFFLPMRLHLLVSDWNVLQDLSMEGVFVFPSSLSSNVSILERISLTPIFRLPALSSPLRFLALFSS